MALAVALLWSATASSKLSAVESTPAPVGPAHREQPRQADTTQTLGDTSRVMLTISETVAPGESERDPCYVSSPLDTLRANIAAPSGMMPEDVSAHCRAATPAREDARMVDGWACFNKHWAATGMRHRPLYFEEINAERYGYVWGGRCLQPFVSATHFLATIPTLPYQMCVNPPCECTYTLGHYRPGSCVPYRDSGLPGSSRAGIFEAVVIVGLIALIP